MATGRGRRMRQTAWRTLAVARHTGRCGLPRSSGHPSLGQMSRCRGFTLTELLVVIAIILVLAGLLAPMAGRVVELAQQTRCGGNLRQVSMVFSAYRNDYEAWPKVEGSIGLLYPHTVGHLTTPAIPDLFKDYANNSLAVFYCPRNAQRRSPSTHWPNSGLQQYAMTYMAMMWADPSRFAVPVPNYRQAGAKTLMFSDMLPTTDASRLVGAVWNHPTGKASAVSGMNCCYGDGRVEWQSAATGTWTRWYKDAGAGFYWWALGW